MTDPKMLTIDIFSDVMCPWCVIGYRQLSKALDALEGEVAAEVRWRPFELNPDMAASGEDIAGHFQRKYGRAPDAELIDRIAAIGDDAGYDIRYQGGDPEPQQRIWNTFLAHCLLRWALLSAGPEVQTRLKLALFDAHFQQRRNVSDRSVLLDVAEAAGLDRAGAAAALDDADLAAQVRAEEEMARRAEVNAVPAMVFGGQFIVPGAQTPEVYIDVLRQVAAQA